jgi:hypothetical protein
MVEDTDLQAYLGALPVREGAVAKERLERLRRDCGCRVGSIVMLSVTATWIVSTLVSPVLGRSRQHTIAIGLLVLFVSGLIGKLMGLIRARVLFHLTVRSLRRRVCAGDEAQALSRAAQAGES